LTKKEPIYPESTASICHESLATRLVVSMVPNNPWFRQQQCLVHMSTAMLGAPANSNFSGSFNAKH